MCNVKRDGNLLTIKADDLVVGDIVEIQAGEIAPADCLVLLVLEHDYCLFSDAHITGEPDARSKSPVTSERDLLMNPDPFILDSSLCESGRCTALVLAVGGRTGPMFS